jgi:hypothetical protein
MVKLNYLPQVVSILDRDCNTRAIAIYVLDEKKAISKFGEPINVFRRHGPFRTVEEAKTAMKSKPEKSN